MISLSHVQCPCIPNPGGSAASVPFSSVLQWGTISITNALPLMRRWRAWLTCVWSGRSVTWTTLTDIERLTTRALQEGPTEESFIPTVGNSTGDETPVPPDSISPENTRPLAPLQSSEGNHLIGASCQRSPPKLSLKLGRKWSLRKRHVAPISSRVLFLYLIFTSRPLLFR